MREQHTPPGRRTAGRQTGSPPNQLSASPGAVCDRSAAGNFFRRGAGHILSPCLAQSSLRTTRRRAGRNQYAAFLASLFVNLLLGAIASLPPRESARSPRVNSSDASGRCDAQRNLRHKISLSEQRCRVAREESSYLANLNESPRHLARGRGRGLRGGPRERGQATHALRLLFPPLRPGRPEVRKNGTPNGEVRKRGPPPEKLSSFVDFPLRPPQRPAVVEAVGVSP